MVTHRVGSSWFCWLLPCVLVACGGQSSRHSRPDGAGAAGSGGSNGSGASGDSSGSGASGGSNGSGASSGSGGSSGSAPLGCDYAGAHYDHGSTFPLGCNACTCSNGTVGCTMKLCPPTGCYVDGTYYEEGESVPSGDCNQCFCSGGNALECTTAVCSPNLCSNIEGEYPAVVAEARSCDPALSIDQCTALTLVGMPCGCHTFMNPAHSDALAKMRELEGLYEENMCADNVLCESCLVPSSAYCSPEGSCQDHWDPPPGASGVSGAAGASGGVAGEGGATGGVAGAD